MVFKRRLLSTEGTIGIKFKLKSTQAAVAAVALALAMKAAAVEASATVTTQAKPVIYHIVDYTQKIYRVAG